MNIANYNTTSGWEYLGLAILLLTIVFLVVAIMVYSNWLKWGPLFKLKWAKTKTSIVSPFIKKNVSIKKDEIVIDEEYKAKINKQLSDARTPQEILEAQEIKEEYDKEIKKFEARLEANKTGPKGIKKWTNKLFTGDNDEKKPVEKSVEEQEQEQVNTIDSLLSNVATSETKTFETEEKSYKDKTENPTGEIEFKKTVEVKIDSVTSETEIEDTAETEIKK